MSNSTRRTWTALLLIGGGVLLGVLGVRHLALEREQTDRRARALEARRLAEAVEDAPRLARQPRTGPRLAWQLEPGRLRGTDEPVSPELVAALAAAREAELAPRVRYQRWAQLAAPDRPTWLRHIASYHAGVAALALRENAQAEHWLEAALEAHPLLVSEGVRVRAAAMQRLALHGLREGTTHALSRFLTAVLDGRRLALGDVVGPADLLLELSEQVGTAELAMPRPLAKRLRDAAERAATGISVLQAVPKRGDLAVVTGRVAHHSEIELQVHELAALVEPPPGFPARAHARLESSDVSGDRLTARLAAPLDAIVVSVDPEPLQAKSLLALIGLALGLGLYTFGALFALRGWRRSRDAARMQADFTAAISHEMKTPIASVRAMAEMLQDGDPELAERYAPRIEGEMRRLGATVRNVLDAAQIERGSLPVALRPADPAAAMTAALEGLQPELARRGFEVSVAIQPAAAPQPLDPDALAGVLVNLVDNAAKFSPPEGTIVVEGEPVSDGYHMAVLDRGPGLGSGNPERLFERFYRGEAAREGAVPGVGLGLHIARQVIAAHGGTLRAREREGGGAAFEIDLPSGTPS